MALDAGLFNVDVWRPALETFGAATHLTVMLYDLHARVVCGPVPSTPLFDALAAHWVDPGLFAACARRCLAQRDARSAAIVHTAHGMAVIGTPLRLRGAPVGAAIAGYALPDFPQSTAIARLARDADVPFARLWDVARQVQPAPERRLLVLGELLQVLGDTLLRENLRTREYEEAVTQLRATAAAKDEFLAVLSHELRSPLTPILGWARMLKSTMDPARIERAADVIERNTRLQLSLVDDLLDLNRASRGVMMLELEVLELGEVVHGALDAAAEQARQKQVTLDCEPCDEPIFVRGDPNRLQQIFRNVLLNAVKFTPPLGTVAVTIVIEGDAAVVQISDSGEGISAEFLPHAFDIFRQQEQGTRREHGGLGIGLALVKRLTDAHGGTVSLASEGPGRGTVVTLRFPRVADAGATTATTAPVMAPQGLVGLRALVIEDMDDARDATALMLQRGGAEVLTARDGVDALTMMSTALVDVVLCDLRMPRMDGFEFLLALDRQGPHPPVIAVSGFASRSDHRRSRAAGFAGHLDKPFDEAHLLGAIAEVLARRAS